jgi:hypothetical protein
MAEWLTQGLDKSNKAEEDGGNFDAMVRKLRDEREMAKEKHLRTWNMKSNINSRAVTKVIS